MRALALDTRIRIVTRKYNIFSSLKINSDISIAAAMMLAACIVDNEITIDNYNREEFSSNFLVNIEIIENNIFYYLVK